MSLTVGDFIRLLQRASFAATAGCSADLDRVSRIKLENPATPLGVEHSLEIWQVMPILLGNPPECDAETANRVASPWIGGDLVLRTALEEICSNHPLGGVMLSSEFDGIWVSEVLFDWITKIPVEVLKRRWVMVPDFPVPVRQVLLRSSALLNVLSRGDLRPIIVADTLVDLRLHCAPWATAWGYSGQSMKDILSIGGFDALTASALLLHRGDRPLDGWDELRALLKIPRVPGWAGAVLERFGTVTKEVLSLHPARHAWLTSRFEASGSCFI